MSRGRGTVSKAMASATAASLSAIEISAGVKQSAMYNLRMNRDVLPENFCIPQCKEVLVLNIPNERFSHSAFTFGEFDELLPGAQQMRSILHLALRSAMQLIGPRLNPTGSNDSTHSGFPIDVCLEPIFEDLHYKHEPTANEHQRARVMEMMKTAYRDEQLFVEAAAGNVHRDDELVNSRFLRGMRERRVIGWRLWFFVRESTASLAKAIVAQLSLQFNAQMEKESSTRPMGEQPEFQRRMKNNNGNQQAALSDKSQIGPTDQNWHIDSPVALLDHIAVYSGDTRLGPTGEDRSLALDSKTPFSNECNILYPGKVFSPEALFKRIAKDERIDLRQRDSKCYYKEGGKEYKFPYNTSVVRLDPSQIPLPVFMQMYLPTYQYKHIEPLFAPYVPATVPDNDEMYDDDGESLDDLDIVNDRVAAVTLGDRDDVSDSTVNGELGGGGGEAVAEAIIHVVQNSTNAKSRRQSELDARVRRRQQEDEEQAAADDDDDDDIADKERDRNGAVRRPMPPQGTIEITPLVPLPHQVRTAAEAKRDAENMLLMMRFAVSKKPNEDALCAVGRNEGGLRKQQTHVLRQTYFHGVFPRVMSIPEREVRARAFAQAQIKAIDSYASSCTSPFSNVSPAHKAINRSLEDRRSRNQLHFLGDYTYFDERMSFFATQMARDFRAYEDVMNIHTAHVEAHLTLLVAYGAYQYRLGLRNHLLFYGEAGVTKSFVAELPNIYFINKTVTVVTSTSDRAGDIDDNDNDRVMIWHEMPLDKITGGSGSGKHGRTGGKGTDQCDNFKMILSEGRSNRQVLQIQGDGRRLNVEMYSEKQQAYIMCTNAYNGVLDPAAADRVTAIHQTLRNRADGESMAEKQFKSMMASSHEKTKREAPLMADLQLMQIILNDVEKLIMLGALPKPSLRAYQYIWRTYANTLKDNYAISLPPRNILKAEGFLRIQVLRNAIRWLYCSPTSRFYRQQYNVYHLLMLAPMMKDSAEQVFCMLDLLREQALEPMQKAILHAVREKFGKERIEEARKLAAKEWRGAPNLMALPLPAAFGAPSMFNGNGVGRGNPTMIGNRGAADRHADNFGAHQVAAGIPLPEESYVKKSGHLAAAKNGYPGERSVASSVLFAQKHQPRRVALDESEADVRPPTAVGAAVAGSIRTPAQVEEMLTYDYLWFDKNLSGMAEHIQKFTLGDVNGRDFDVKKLTDRFFALSHITIMAPPYVRNPDLSSPNIAIPKAGAPHLPMRMFWNDVANNRLGVHASLVFGAYVDPHTAAIQSCFNSHIVPGHYISGRPLSDALTYLLEMREIKAHKGVALDLASTKVGALYDTRGNKAAEADAGSRHVAAVLMGTYDEASARSALEAISMPCDKYSIAPYLDTVDRELALEMPEARAAKMITYPEDEIEQARKRLITRNIAHELAHKMTIADVEQRVASGELVARPTVDAVDERHVHFVDEAQRRAAELFEKKKQEHSGMLRQQKAQLDAGSTLIDLVPPLTFEKNGILGVISSADQARKQAIADSELLFVDDDGSERAAAPAVAMPEPMLADFESTEEEEQQNPCFARFSRPLPRSAHAYQRDDSDDDECDGAEDQGDGALEEEEEEEVDPMNDNWAIGRSVY